MRTHARLRLLAITFAAIVTSSCNRNEPLIGVWSFDNDETRAPSEEPFFHLLTVYPSHMDYSEGNGSVTLQGEWRDGGFWCPNPNGDGEIEVAKLLDAEDVELQESAFDPHRTDTEVLYKKEGSEEEMRAMAAKYPPPYTFPPPAGVIKPGMTEFQLDSLPWKPDQVMPTDPDMPYSRGTIFVFHSDDSRFDPLRVTIKNHRVVQMQGGYE